MANRLRYYRKNAGLTLQQLASKLNCSFSLISKYEKGEVPLAEEMIFKLSTLFGCTPSQLLGYDINIDNNTKNNGTNNSMLIPILNTVRAGMPTLICDDNITDYMEVEKNFEKLGEVFALRIKGDSMQPRMFEGDLIIVQRTNDINSGEVGIVLVNGDEATVKVVKKMPTGVMLVPFNNAYDPIFYTNDEVMSLPVVVVGKVIELRATSFKLK